VEDLYRNVEIRQRDCRGINCFAPLSDNTTVGEWPRLDDGKKLQSTRTKTGLSKQLGAEAGRVDSSNPSAAWYSTQAAWNWRFSKSVTSVVDLP